MRSLGPDTVWRAIERVQLEAACVVGGTQRSASKEAVLMEAGLCEIRREAESSWSSVQLCLDGARNGNASS